VAGLISLPDLLKARALNLEAERRRERISPMHLFFPRRARAPMPERLTGLGTLAVLRAGEPRISGRSLSRQSARAGSAV